MTDGFSQYIERRFSLKAIVAATRLFIVLFVALCLVSCAPVNLYTIDLKYSPTATTPQMMEKGKEFTVTLARFNDTRKVEDKLVIGTVVKSDGGKIPVLPKYTKPVDALLKGMQVCLENRGYNVSRNTPDWDLTEENIDQGWGDVLIGGTIDDLEVVCLKGFPVMEYNAKVKFTVYLADVKRKKIFYQIAVDANPSLRHVRFSEGILAQQINGALTEAIENIFEGRKLYEKMRLVTSPSENSTSK